jgi:hypothetical protein
VLFYHSGAERLQSLETRVVWHTAYRDMAPSWMRSGDSFK